MPFSLSEVKCNFPSCVQWKWLDSMHISMARILKSNFVSNLSDSSKIPSRGAREHIAFSIFAYFQLNEYVIHFVYIQHSMYSIYIIHIRRMDTICILWWHRISMRNHRISMRHTQTPLQCVQIQCTWCVCVCICVSVYIQVPSRFSIVQHSVRVHVCFWNWFFAFANTEFCPKLHAAFCSLCSPLVRSSKLHNLQSKIT